MSRSSPPPPRVTQAEFSAGAARAEQLPPPQTLEVAFAGRSNVGKSSLMNALIERRKLVCTSGTPGCTRQISLFEITTRLGSRFTLVDLPGYGYAKRSKSERAEWAELINGYLLQRPALSLVVALVDVRRGREEDDEQLVELLQQVPPRARAPVGVLWVATKLDKVPGSERKLAMARLREQTGHPWIGFSTELPETHEVLWRRVLLQLGLDQPAVAAAPEAAPSDAAPSGPAPSGPAAPDSAAPDSAAP
jgi:GTP-binding protein